MNDDIFNFNLGVAINILNFYKFGQWQLKKKRVNNEAVYYIEGKEKEALTELLPRYKKKVLSYQDLKEITQKLRDQTLERRKEGGYTEEVKWKRIYFKK